MRKIRVRVSKREKEGRVAERMRRALLGPHEEYTCKDTTINVSRVPGAHAGNVILNMNTGEKIKVMARIGDKFIVTRGKNPASIDAEDDLYVGDIAG